MEEEHCKIDELKRWNDSKNAIEQNLNWIKAFKYKKSGSCLTSVWILVKSIIKNVFLHKSKKYTERKLVIKYEIVQLWIAA